MKFYCTHAELYGNVAERIVQLRNASNKLNVEFIALDSISLDYTKIPNLEPGDMLYNVARGSERLESLLLNEGIKTFYLRRPEVIEENTDTTKYSLLHSKVNLATPTTIFHSTTNRALLRIYVDKLNGFPIIVKMIGGTLGVGTIISYNFESLFSLTDYLCATKRDFLLRQYIPPMEVARLIVVGSKVVASNQKFVAKDDFRTSVIEKMPIPKSYSKIIQDLAIKAANIVNIESAGVDILIDQSGNSYVLEVNMPHDFVTTAAVTSIDVAYLMVQHILNKPMK